MNQAELQAFMAAIRLQESSNNYRAMGPSTRYGRATGGYQFLDSTWGGYGGYRRAVDAPPAVQDARAAQLMTQYYQQFGSWELVAVAWHAGPGRAKTAKERGLASLGNLNDGLSRTVDYANKAVKQMNTYLKDQGVPVSSAPGAGGDKSGLTPSSSPFAGDKTPGMTGGPNQRGTIVRPADDPLGFSSGGPGTVVAPTTAVAPISFGSGELDLNDAEKVQAEVDLKYGKMSDEEFLTEIYDDVLGRDPDKAGFDYWLGRLESGTSRAEVFRGFYASPEGGESAPPLLSEVEIMVRQRYPDWAWALDIDEVRDILLEATDPTRGMDDATFMSRIRATEWWQSTEATQREWDARSAMDPATAQREIEKLATELGRRATALGAPVDEAFLSSLAEKVLRFGLTEAEINDSLASQFDSADPRGDVAANLQQARAMAKSYLVNVDDAELIKWAQDVAIGVASPDDLQRRMQMLAKAKFGQNQQLSELIDAGVAPATYFSDHQRLIAQELDMSVSQVDLMDPKYQRVLSQAAGNVVRPMDLDETRQHIRTTAAFNWENSSTGRRRIAETTQGLLQAFGKVA